MGELGKRIRAFGVQVTILEHSRRDEICFSHIMNENCTVVSEMCIRDRLLSSL